MNHRIASPHRRVALQAALATLAGAACGVHAQTTWPQPGQPIRIVVTQGAGAGSDVLARQVAHELQGVLGHPVIVENRPGAAGTLGHSFVAKAPPDGQTLILSSTGLLLVTPEITSGVRVPHTDFAPVAGINEAPYVLLVPELPQAPKNLAQLREQMANQRNTYGSSGAGTMAHLAAALILQRAGLEADHIPYKANAQVMQDLAGGRLTFACDTVASARPLLQTGKVRALAVTGARRLASLPDVPTLAEAGLADTVVVTKAGLLAPKGTPPQVIERLAAAMQKSLNDPQFIARLAQQESRARYLSPSDYAAELNVDAKFWVGLVRQINIKGE